MSSLDDIREWPQNGIPVGSVWMTGHNLKWVVPQVQAGRRLLPHTLLPTKNNINSSQWSDPAQPQSLAAYAAEFAYINANNLPLVLRHQSNLSTDMTVEPRGTYPGNTPVTWQMDGTTLDSRPQCDHLASPSFWADRGTLYGTSLWATYLESLVPNPAWIGIWDNNEGGYPEPQSYCTPLGGGALEWRSYDELGNKPVASGQGGVSLSLRDRVWQSPGQLAVDPDPYELWPELFGNRVAQYQALYAAFSQQRWTGKPLLSNAYSAAAQSGWAPPPHIVEQVGLAPEARCYDGAGPTVYLGNPITPDLWSTGRLLQNIPAWEWSKTHNPDAFRTVFVSINGKLASKPHADYPHVTPGMFRAWCEWLAWLARPANGGPVLLQYWIASATKPTDPFFTPAEQAVLPVEMQSLKHGDYSIGPALAADSICREGVRDFWRSGIAEPVSVSHSQVRATSARLDGRHLVFVWSPCELTGTMGLTVDGVEFIVDVPSRGARYYLAEPPPPVGLVIREVA